MSFQGFNRKAMKAEGLAPDFAVLIAGLSAHQSASVTARRQITLDSKEEKPVADASTAPAPIDLFVHGTSSEATGNGSFNTAVARSLTENS